MDKYHDEQLYDILRARAKWGLEEDVITDDQLYQIANAAASDARLAIGMLRTAANTADRKNQHRIADDILHDAAEDVEDPRTKRTVRTYLSKMEQYNLLEAEGTSRDRKYSLVDSAVASPTS